MAAATALKIGEVAKRSGLSVKTIRFYCDEGLVHPTSRSEGGYRLFDNDIFAELALIRTLKAGGSSRRLSPCAASTTSSTACWSDGKIVAAARVMDRLNDVQTLMNV